MAQRSRSQWEGLLRLRISIIVLGVALAAAAAYGLPLGQWVTDLAQGARATGSLGVGLFFVAYVAVFAVLILSVMATGLDQVTAFSAVAACLNNLGPGLGDVSAHYGAISDTTKFILSFAMVLGRLEIFTLLVLLTPAFWQS